jgi:hypothetical protein
MWRCCVSRDRIGRPEDVLFRRPGSILVEALTDQPAPIESRAVGTGNRRHYLSCSRGGYPHCSPFRSWRCSASCHRVLTSADCGCRPTSGCQPPSYATTSCLVEGPAASIPLHALNFVSDLCDRCHRAGNTGRPGIIVKLRSEHHFCTPAATR